MWSVPSFLSWPFSLPSLPSISLPANIQRRFLSYVLQRTLGRYVRAGGLDVERIQAQISEGWVEIEGLEVNTEEINSLIPDSVPLTLTSGALSKVTARVPFPNLLSDPLSLTLETLTLDFTLSPLSTKGKSPDSRSRTSSAPLLSPGIDLASSVTSAADDFLHEELDAYEEAELDRSIRQSLVLSQTDPFSNDDLPGAFPFPSQSQSQSQSHGAGPNPNSPPASHAVESTTVLAGLVERILARLQFKVKDIRIRIRFDDKSHGVVFELRIAEVRYADESESSEDPALRQTIRAVRISSVSIYMLDLPSPSPTSSPARPPFHSTSSRSSSVSSTTTSTSSVSSSDSSTTDPQAEMYMSLAVADLRQSVADTVVSGASVYQSALSERAIEEEPEGRDGGSTSDNRSNNAGSPRTSIRGRSRSRSATPTGHPRPPNEVILLSLGSEDIVMRLKTTRHSGPSAAAPQSPPTDPHPSQSPSRSTSHPSTGSQLPALDIELSMGTIAALISPDQAATILCALQAATRPSSEPSPGSSTPDPAAGSNVQPRLDARVRIKAIVVALVYDMRATDSTGFATAAAQFWAKPGATYIPFGHLKLRLEGLDSGYSSKGFVPRASSRGRPKSHSMSTSTRRTSNAAHFGPRPPVMTLTLSEMSIFEYLASDPPSEGMTDDTPPGGAFPVLIFDANLPRQYDVAPGAQSPLGLGLGVRLSSQSAPASKIVPPPTFPDFDTVDWRNSGLQKKSGVGDKAWKVRPKGRGVLKGGAHFAGEAEEGPVISVRKELSAASPAIVQTQPVHIFVDLSLVERLLPMLRSIAPAMRPPPVERDTPLGLRPTLPTPGSGLPRVQSSHYVIEDLDAQASSLSTVQAVQGPSEILVLRCPVVRLDIRCPAPPNRRSTWGDGGHLRSGIVTLDIHGLAARIGQPRTADLTEPLPARRASQIAPPSEHAGAVQVEWQKMVFFFCRVPEKRSSAFLVIGPLAPEEGEEDMSPLLPFVEIKTVATPAQSKMQVLTARIPSVQAKIRQPTIEGLQFFADDITHWLDGAFGDGSAPKPRDDLKMIGSRFFGSKASSSASSSAIDDDEEDDTAATRLRVAVSESDIALHVPREDGGERVLSLRASDVDAKVESNVTGRQETAFNLVVMDADFLDRSDPASPTRILGRTTPLTLTAHNSPVVSLRFSSLTDIATGTKETGIKLTSTSWTFFLTQDLAWVQELKAFAKTPEGVFEDVVPSEITRIALNLYDCSVHVAAPTVGGALVLVLGSMEVRTDLVSDAEENTVEMGLAGGYVLAVDDRAAVGTLQSGYQLSVEAWRRAGYASLLEIEAFDMQVFRDLSGSHVVVVDILQAMGKITACADSMATLGVLVGDIAKLAPAKPPADEPERSPAMLEHSINVFSSVDEEAFKRIPDIVSGADMIEDDLPTNLDYLDAATRHSAAALTMDRSTGETLRTWQTEGDRGDLDRFAGEVNGETIKILYNLPFEVEEDYWDTLPVIRNGLGDDTKLGKLRVRVHDCNIGVFLHDGYDWARTRKAIEDEIKAVRKRLEKIRQLLASGQKADESIEKTGTSSVLFNSVYIGLDQSRENLDSAALIAAIDEELEDLGGDETASQSSWQSFPTARGGAGPGAPGAGSSRPVTKTRLKGRRLARSKRPQIEIALRGIRAEVDVFGPEDQVASRVNARVKSLEILDHIKTSTWKKFLTEMKADSRGNIRETDADMVRVELVAVRPSLPNTDEEYRLKAKMLPLRLHVDQDALDFLKRFGSFQPPAPAPGSSAPSQPEPQPRTSSKEPFFQHVEIYPVEIKLDYKPKRVDFAALREGRTIELMNFFHFDGAEMTLRHITMSGVSGWSRLSTMLQDIWTPDVKANQLADVISGVSPIRSMVNVGSGVADLILLPIEQYRKDGRLARGVQRGTNSFVRSTAMEMMKLGARLATGTQVILERAEGVLGGGSRFAEGLVAEVEPSLMERNEMGSGLDGEEGSEDEGLGELVSRYANQPSGAVEGVQEAYRSLSKNINSAAQTILAVPMEVYERSGGDGPLKAVVRAVPIAVLKPMIGASEAVSKTLLGVRNSLDPQARKELGDKYK